jgi:hypothetical protein
MVNRDKLDWILTSEEELVPSSGFVASVMERVREETAAPAPIPFPWKRLVPAMVMIVAALLWCAVKLVQQGVPELHSLEQIQPHLPVALTGPTEGLAWVAAALVVSLLSWLLTRRLIGRSGLI